MLAAAVAIPVLLVSPMSASAATPAGAYCQSPVDLSPATSTAQATIDRFDIGRHESAPPRFDRVVIGLSAPATNYQVHYVPQLIQDGSGLPVPLKGDADIEVRLENAIAHDQNGNSTVPVRNYEPVNWGSLRQAKLVSDFEGITVFGLGVSRRVDFQVFMLTGPPRLVIDVAMPGEHPWNCQSGAVRAYFVDDHRVAANTPPFTTPVWRRVLTPAVAGGALHSLFHWPLPDEAARGLRFVNSDALGFTGLSISNGIARVQLTGGCDAHGSTVSIADEIMPTLKQFFNVRYVKIYDPAGHTAAPNGNVDSIPACLNP